MVGVAVMLTVGGLTMTVTVAWSVVLPPGPVAVMVYVVVVVGETVVELLQSTEPTPLSIEQVSA